jgi:hypothetical protein
MAEGGTGERIHVDRWWVDEFGMCEDCAELPASYFAPDLVVTHTEVQQGLKLCPICAALHASYGERLERLWKEEE